MKIRETSRVKEKKPIDNNKLDAHNGSGSGAEAILPIDKLPEILGLDKMVGNNLAVNIENFNNNREQDINQLAEEIAFYLKRKRF